MGGTFNFGGMPLISMYLGFGTIMLMTVAGFGFVYIGNYKAIVVGLVLLGLVAFVLRRSIRVVRFSEAGIQVSYVLGKSRHVAYKDVKKFYESVDGPVMAQIFVMKYENQDRKGKITFVCSDSELEALLDTYFDGKRIRRR